MNPIEISLRELEMRADSGWMPSPMRARQFGLGAGEAVAILFCLLIGEPLGDREEG